MQQLTQSAVEFPRRSLRDWYTRNNVVLGRGSFGIVQEVRDDREILMRLKYRVSPAEEIQGYFSENVYVLSPAKPDLYTFKNLTSWQEAAHYLAQYQYKDLKDLYYPRDQAPDSRLELILALVKMWSQLYQNTPLENDDILTALVGPNHQSRRPTAVVKSITGDAYNAEREMRAMRSAKTEVYALGKVASTSPILIKPPAKIRGDVVVKEPVGCEKIFDTNLIVCLRDYFVSTGENVYHVVLSLTPGPNLQRLLYSLATPNRLMFNLPTPLPGEFVWYVAWSMMHALRHIHEREIIHNDIKLENVIYDPVAGGLTLLDFGLSCHLNLGQRRPGKMDSCDSFGGTIYYISPEQVKYGKRYPTTDVWALGILLWELATGEEYIMDGNFPGDIAARVEAGATPDLKKVPLTMLKQGAFREMLGQIFDYDHRNRPLPMEILKFINFTFQPRAEFTEENDATLGLWLHDQAMEKLAALKDSENAQVEFADEEMRASDLFWDDNEENQQPGFLTPEKLK